MPSARTNLTYSPDTTARSGLPDEPDFGMLDVTVDVANLPLNAPPTDRQSGATINAPPTIDFASTFQPGEREAVI